MARFVSLKRMRSERWAKAWRSKQLPPEASQKPSNPRCENCLATGRPESYFRPNCALDTISSFWNMAFMFPPHPSPSHMYMMVL